MALSYGELVLIYLDSHEPVKLVDDHLDGFIAGWLSGLLVERRTCVSQILGSTPGQVAAV